MRANTVRLKIIGNEIIKNASKYETCMVFKLPIIFKRTRSRLVAARRRMIVVPGARIMPNYTRGSITIKVWVCVRISSAMMRAQKMYVNIIHAWCTMTDEFHANDSHMLACTCLPPILRVYGCVQI